MRVLVMLLVASMLVAVACQQAQEQKPAEQETMPAKPAFVVATHTWPAKTVATVTVMGEEVLVDSILPEGVNSIFELTVPKGIQEISAWATENDYALAGHPAAVFPDDPSTVPMGEVRTEIQWEIMPPEEEEIETTERIEIKTLDSVMVASGVYTGSYDDPEYEDALKTLMEWPEAHGYQVAGAFMEVYHTDPQQVAPEEWKTEIAYPVMPAPQEEAEEEAGE